MTEHSWPTDDTQHVWGPWMSHTATPKERKQYRQCVHPACKAFEIRETPTA